VLSGEVSPNPEGYEDQMANKKQPQTIQLRLLVYPAENSAIAAKSTTYQC